MLTCFHRHCMNEETEANKFKKSLVLEMAKSVKAHAPDLGSLMI